MSSLAPVIATQIIVETVPLSSSGHVWLIQKLIAHLSSPATEELLDLLFLPTALILLLFFRKRIYQIVHTGIAGLISKPHFRKKLLNLWTQTIRNIFIANGTTAIIYAGLHLIGARVAVYPAHYTTPMILGFLTTLLLLSTTYFAPQGKEVCSISPLQALLIGGAQSLSLLPAISRFATTLVAARWLRLNPRTAIFMSISLQASLFLANALKNFIQNPSRFISLAQIVVEENLFTIICAMGVSYLGLTLTAKLTKERKLWRFALYLPLPILLALLG